MGTITRSQLVAIGYTAAEIRGRLERGELRRARPQVFLTAGSPPSWEQDITVAWLWAGPNAVLSHRTAGELWKLEGVPPDFIELTVPLSQTRAAKGVLIHRRSDLAKHDIVKHRHLRITSPTRTLIDLASVLEAEQFELALEDSLRRRLTSLARLNRRVDQLCTKGRRGCGALRILIEQRTYQNDTESGLETKVARSLRLGRLPPPTRQHKIYSDKLFVARVDFAYPEAKLAIEAQSYKHHEGRRAWLRDMSRDRALRALGWEIIYVTDEDLRLRREETIEHIRRLLRKRAPQLLLSL